MKTLDRYAEALSNLILLALIASPFWVPIVYFFSH